MSSYDPVGECEGSRSDQSNEPDPCPKCGAKSNWPERSFACGTVLHQRVPEGPLYLVYSENCIRRATPPSVKDDALTKGYKDTPYRKDRELVYEVEPWQWPEFVAFAERLGIPLEVSMTAIDIRIAVGEVVKVKLEFHAMQPKQ